MSIASARALVDEEIRVEAVEIPGGIVVQHLWVCCVVAASQHDALGRVHLQIAVLALADGAGHAAAIDEELHGLSEVAVLTAAAHHLLLEVRDHGLRCRIPVAVVGDGALVGP